MRFRASLFLTSSLIAFLAWGCQYGRNASRALTTIQKLDAEGRVEETYTVYRDSEGHEVIHGVCVGFYPGGAKLYEITYEDGKPQGKCSSFSEDGKKVDVGWFRNGKPWEGDIQIGEFMWRFQKGKALGVWTESGFVRKPLPSQIVDMEFH
jgi:hypothetical protein